MELHPNNEASPVYFTFYFDKDFHPDDYYLIRKSQFCHDILKQKIIESGFTLKDYEQEPMIMCHDNKPLITTIINAGNMWQDLVNVFRIAWFPKGYSGPREIVTLPEENETIQ